MRKTVFVLLFFGFLMASCGGSDTSTARTPPPQPSVKPQGTVVEVLLTMGVDLRFQQEFGVDKVYTFNINGRMMRTRLLTHVAAFGAHGGTLVPIDHVTYDAKSFGELQMGGVDNMVLPPDWQQIVLHTSNGGRIVIPAP